MREAFFPDTRGRMPLTPRQAEIVRLAGSDLTDGEISARIGITVGTLRSHWDRIRERTGLTSRGAVIALLVGAEEVVARDEAKLLARILAVNGLLAWTALPCGRVDYVGEGLATFSGVSRERLVGPGCRALMPERQHKAAAERWAKAQDTGRGYAARVDFRSAAGVLVPHWIVLRPDGGRWIGTARPMAASDDRATVWL